ncbi:reverse transcriptase [Penicillium majusculum]|nr:reverse transcriptase [Penicillium majusculum]
MTQKPTVSLNDKATSDIVVYSDTSGHHDHLGAAVITLNKDQNVIESHQIQVGSTDQWSIHIQTRPSEPEVNAYTTNISRDPVRQEGGTALLHGTPKSGGCIFLSTFDVNQSDMFSLRWKTKVGL